MNFFEILQNIAGFFYRRFWGSPYFCTSIAPKSTLLA